MRPKPFKRTVSRLLERDYYSHKLWSSHCDCNATCVVSQSNRTLIHVYHKQIVGLFMITLHRQQNYSKEGTQTSRTEQTMPSTKLQCLNSSMAGSKADMFHIYSQESKSFVTSIISNSLESSRISLDKTYTITNYKIFKRKVASHAKYASDACRWCRM